VNRRTIYPLLKMRKKTKNTLNSLPKKKSSLRTKQEVLELPSVLKFMANSIKRAPLKLRLSPKLKNKKEESDKSSLKLSCSLLLMIKNKISSSMPWKKKLTSILYYYEYSSYTAL